MYVPLHAQRGEDPAHLAFHYDPIGVAHGGLAAALLDSAMSCAVHTTLPAGVGYTTLDLNLTFVRALTVESGPVCCEGKVVHRGRRVSTAEGFGSRRAASSPRMARRPA